MGRGGASWLQGLNFHQGGAWRQGLSSVGGGASWRRDLDGVGLGGDVGQTYLEARHEGWGLRRRLRFGGGGTWQPGQGLRASKGV